MSLRIWLVHVGEILPLDGGAERPLRMRLLADALTARGHDVQWWTSTFDHSYRTHRYQTDARVVVRPRYELRMIKGPGYRRSVSLQRMLDHAYLAKRFRQLAPLESPPDLVVCTIPTIELSDAAVQYARRNAIPAVVDVRDTWPDALVDAIPRWLRRAARLAAAPLAAQAARALRMASAITAVSPAYLDWALRRSGRGPSSWDRVFPHGYPRISYSTTELEAAAQRLRSLGVNGSKVIVWFVGMLGRTCDLSSVIRAARRLAPDHRSDIQFVISGTGDNEGRWRAEAADVRSVVFTGWVRGAEIAYLTSVARVGLAAYAAGAPQTYPNKFFEYMHAGLPIVSSLSGPAADLLDEHACGLTYRAGDDQDLAQVLRRLLSDDALRARIGANSRAAFDRLYAADIVYPDMAAYLESLSLSGAST